MAFCLLWPWSPWLVPIAVLIVVVSNHISARRMLVHRITHIGHHALEPSVAKELRIGTDVLLMAALIEKDLHRNLSAFPCVK